MIHAALKTGKFVNRGFLNGCVCPIYGIGVVLILICLTPINKNVFVLFAASFALTSVLEFLTGFILEKLFKTKWWDYSKEHFNIKGYVCLKYSILWGLACIIVVDLVHPFIAELVIKIPDLGIKIIGFVLDATLLVDLIFTLMQLMAHRKNSDTFDKICAYLKYDSNAIGKALSDTAIGINNKLQAIKKKITSTRLYKAFPEQKHRNKNTEKIPNAEEIDEIISKNSKGKEKPEIVSDNEEDLK